MKDKWTQQFQGKLDGYEMAAPEMEWTELDKALADNAIADNALAKNKRPFMTLVCRSLKGEKKRPRSKTPGNGGSLNNTI